MFVTTEFLEALRADSRMVRCHFRQIDSTFEVYEKAVGYLQD